MRILVTNDDGVMAPGIAALAHAVVVGGHECVVVAPLEDWSGAGTAIGRVYERDGVSYERRPIEGHEDVLAIGIDGSPSLAVMLSCLGAFGPPADLVLSGINHGSNVGNASLHSGTVGAVLTGATFGLSGIAVSIRYRDLPVPWDVAADLAMAVVPVITEAPAPTVWNLNVPSVALHEIKGFRRARLSSARVVHGAAVTVSGEQDWLARHEGDASGVVDLEVYPPWEDPTLHPDDDARLLGDDFVAITELSRLAGTPVAGAAITSSRTGDHHLDIPKEFSTGDNGTRSESAGPLDKAADLVDRALAQMAAVSPN